MVQGVRLVGEGRKVEYILMEVCKQGPTTLLESSTRTEHL